MHICGIVMPRKEVPILLPNEELQPCLRPPAHGGMHLMQNPRGQYFRWSFDEVFCGGKNRCVCRADGELIECFSYREITTEEAKALLNIPTD